MAAGEVGVAIREVMKEAAGVAGTVGGAGGDVKRDEDTSTVEMEAGGGSSRCWGAGKGGDTDG